MRSCLSYFQASFGEASSSLANTKQTTEFLMKFLTDLVPFETAVFLKVIRKIRNKLSQKTRLG